MLSRQEQQVWDDIQRFWAEEAEEPPRAAVLGPRRTGRTAHDPDVPIPVVAGAWVTILLILFGAIVPGLAVGVITAVGWLLWHSWPQLSRQPIPGTPPETDEDNAGRRPADQASHGRPRSEGNAD